MQKEGVQVLSFVACHSNLSEVQIQKDHVNTYNAEQTIRKMGFERLRRRYGVQPYDWQL